MSKVAHYLQEHLDGEVITSPDARRYFSTDTSVLTLTPAMAVYPRSESDVRKTLRFAWQLAERGRVIPITARGAGTDQGGAALGAGIILAFPAHMNHILGIDGKSGITTLEPGVNYGKLQQTLHTHGRFLPPFPSSIEYCTVGGAVANNAAGEKTFKYGSTRDFVKSLRVVLANGEVIKTGRLSKRELGKKLGLTTFEGEIYRALDALLEDNKDSIAKMEPHVTKNSAGYCLDQVRKKDGSFDLTPLFVGSQGTLGVVTEIEIETEPYNPSPALFVAHFDSVDQAQQAVLEIRELQDAPSTVEMVDSNLIELVEKINPNQLKDVISKPFPRVVLFVEFDNTDRSLKKMLKKAKKVLDKHASQVILEMDPEKQDKLWAIRHSAAVVIAYGEGGAKALPIIEDGVVPPERFGEYLDGVYDMFKRNHLQAAVWGHAGDANLHMQPFLDLSKVGDRQTALRMLEEYYTLVMSLGGSTSGEHGDGRLRAAFLPKLYGEEIYGLFQKVKQIFDPYNILNPGVKVNVEKDAVKKMLRTSYSLEHLSDHLPRS